MITKNYILIAVSILLTACAGVTQPIKFKESNIVTEESYLSSKAINGVVLVIIVGNRSANNAALLYLVASLSVIVVLVLINRCSSANSSLSC